jgi:hypothetical protein
MAEGEKSEVMRVELPKEVILKIKSANGRRNAIRPLLEYWGREKSIELGAEKIATIVATIRGESYGYLLSRAKELLQKEERKTVTENGLVISDQTTKPLKVLPPQKSIPPLPDNVNVTAENGKGRTISFKELIPKNTDEYFRKRMGNKSDVEAMLELFNVCNCQTPEFEVIEGAEKGKAHGVKFCKGCGRPDWREPIILHGDPGCGKNRLIDEVAECLQIPVLRVQFDGTTVPADICGEVMQNTEGKWSWVDRFLTHAVRYGCIFVGDEINMANQEVTSLLHHLLEKNGKLVVAANSEVIVPHPNFWFIGTMNKDCKGTKPLNEALRDRCTTIEIKDSKNIAYKLTNDRKLVDAMYTLKRNPEKLSHPIGLRSMIRFVKVQKQLGTRFAIEEFCAKFTADEAVDIKKALTVLVPREEQATMLEDEKEDADWDEGDD